MNAISPITRTLDTSFDALAAGAAMCAQFGGSFALYIKDDGNWSMEDAHDTLEGAADGLADMWADWEGVAIREFAPSGRSVDATAEAMALVEKWAHARHDLAPWESAGDDGPDHGLQRSVALCSGHFA